MRLVFDIETDGLLDSLTRIHCVALRDVDRDTETRLYGPNEIKQAIDHLQDADELIGHNIIKFDLPAIQKATGVDLRVAKITDTLVMTRLLWPELKASDAVNREFPRNLIGSQSLEAWGHRIGLLKGSFKGPWEFYTVEMGAYNVLDVDVNYELWKRIEAHGYTAQSYDLEHRVAEVLWAQEQHGFAFDEAAAGALFGDLLARRDKVGEELAAMFQPWWVSRGEFVPAKDNKKMGYSGGVPMTKVDYVEFNPASRDHIARGLQVAYGWKPTEFTDTGKPKVDESTIRHTNFPASPLVMEYLLLEKRIGQIATGQQAWLKCVKNGRIHGGVNTNGAVTGRMTHSHPNIAQVPRVGSPFGKECRSLFKAGPGKVLVGVDASGLELRCLAHYLAPYDGGEYGKAICEGDIHTVNQKAAGLPTRDAAKTFIYATLYGAGPPKIGGIVGGGAREGKRLIDAFLRNTPALAKLKLKIAKVVGKKLPLPGLDGRQLMVRSEHAALNTLLQSAGALIMKQALVDLTDNLAVLGYTLGRDYAYVANVHDEWQIETTPELADEIKEQAINAITHAGRAFGFRCPLAAEGRIGRTWADTH